MRRTSGITATRDAASPTAVGGEPVLVEIGEVDLPRRLDGVRFVVQRQALLQQAIAHRAIGQAGVEMRQMVIVGQPAGERALAGRSGTVDGDEEGFVAAAQ